MVRKRTPTFAGDSSLDEADGDCVEDGEESSLELPSRWLCFGLFLEPDGLPRRFSPDGKTSGASSIAVDFGLFFTPLGRPLVSVDLGYCGCVWS